MESSLKRVLKPSRNMGRLCNFELVFCVVSSPFCCFPWSLNDVDRRKKTGSRRGIIIKEDLGAEDFSAIWRAPLGPRLPFLSISSWRAWLAKGRNRPSCSLSQPPFSSPLYLPRSKTAEDVSPGA